MKEKGSLHILDALENLNTLADADSLEEIEVTEDALLLPHHEQETLAQRNFWIQAGPDEMTFWAIRNTFRTVHEYLESFYSRMKERGETKRLVEGVNTIMVLVGEAAKKLESYGAIFKKHIHEFEEFKELEDFYRNQVIKESFLDFSKTEIARRDHFPEDDTEIEEDLHALLSEEQLQSVSGAHLLNDLELVKRDHLYELFYLKNEAGHPFYTYELARRIKLACDFGEFAEEYFGEDPLLQIKNWEDKSLHLRALELLARCQTQVTRFYSQCLKYKEMEMVGTLHNALMALMLAANPRNLIRQFSLKGCHLYFQDFLLFLRELILQRDFQKLLIYSPPTGQVFFQDLLDLTHTLCYQLFTMPAHNQEIGFALKQILERRFPQSPPTLSQMLKESYETVTEVLHQHPNGPVFKTLDLIREEEDLLFDPLHQGNLASRQWQLTQPDHPEESCIFLHLPCPTLQEMIHRAHITEEFKMFLRSLGAEERLLFINFQDRTSWQEHARALAIEELGRQAEFAQKLTVVTLAEDTDFYNQTEVYESLSNAAQFINHFLQHLQDEATGYCFPLSLKPSLFSSYMPALMAQIHKVFFAQKTELIFLERLDFIQLAYHFIELKLIELIKPHFVAFSSKDALDIGATADLGFIALLATDSKREWSNQEYERLRTLLLGPTLMLRERAVHRERFERLLLLVQRLERTGPYLDAFAFLYKSESLNWHISI